MSFMRTGAAAFALAVACYGSAAVQANPDDKRVTLTGCVIKGDGGYVLANATAAPAPHGMAGATRAEVRPESPAMATIAGRTFYWLDDEDDIEEHAGRRVEVTGELDDVELGKISVERENGMVEIEFKVDGEKKVTVKVPDVPSAVGTSGVSDRERDYDVVVKKIDVKSVKVLASTCQ